MSEKDSRSAQIEVLQNYHGQSTTDTVTMVSGRSNHTRMLIFLDFLFLLFPVIFHGEMVFNLADVNWRKNENFEVKAGSAKRLCTMDYHGRGVWQLTTSQQIYITSIWENGNPVELPLSKRCLATDNFAQRLDIGATAEGGTFPIFSMAFLPCARNPKTVKAILFSAWAKSQTFDNIRGQHKWRPCEILTIEKTSCTGSFAQQCEMEALAGEGGTSSTLSILSLALEQIWESFKAILAWAFPLQRLSRQSSFQTVEAMVRTPPNFEIFWG